MGISERKKKILAAVVDEYIRTAEPVGSKAIAQSGELHCSSATIRNELAELVSLGYLEQPHTSAGRVPTNSTPFHAPRYSTPAWPKKQAENPLDFTEIQRVFWMK